MINNFIKNYYIKRSIYKKGKINKFELFFNILFLEISLKHDHLHNIHIKLNNSGTKFSSATNPHITKIKQDLNVGVSIQLIEILEIILIKFNLVLD